MNFDQLISIFLRPILSLVLFANLAGNHAHADDRLFYAQHKLKLSSYPVVGSSAQDFTESMLKNGPKDLDNKRYFAYTSWSFRIGSRKQAISSISKASDLKCKIYVQLPALHKVDLNKDIKLKKSWQSFYEQLIFHENIHVKHAFRTCHILKRSKLAKAGFKSFALRLKKRDKSLDIRTQNGKLQGVSLD